MMKNVTRYKLLRNVAIAVLLIGFLLPPIGTIVGVDRPIVIFRGKWAWIGSDIFEGRTCIFTDLWLAQIIIVTFFFAYVYSKKPLE